MTFTCCLICDWTQEDDILNGGNGNQLNYSLLSFKLLTLGNTLTDNSHIAHNPSEHRISLDTFPLEHENLNQSSFLEALVPHHLTKNEHAYTCDLPQVNSTQQRHSTLPSKVVQNKSHPVFSLRADNLA